MLLPVLLPVLCCWCAAGVLLVCCCCAAGVLLPVLCCWCAAARVVLLVCCCCAAAARVVLLVCCCCAAVSPFCCPLLLLLPSATLPVRSCRRILLLLAALVRCLVVALCCYPFSEYFFLKQYLSAEPQLLLGRMVHLNSDCLLP